MSSSRPPPPPDPVTVLSGKCAVTSLVFMDSDAFVTGHQNGQIQEWNISVQRTLAAWEGHSDSIIWLASIHGRLLSQGRDGLVKAWTKTKEDSTRPWSLHGQVPSAPLTFCNSAILSSISCKLLVIPTDETSHVKVHEILTTSDATDFFISETPLTTLKPSSNVKDYGMCMKMCTIDQTDRDSNTNWRLLIGYESGSIALWNALLGEMLFSIRMHDDSVMCLTCWSDLSSGHTTGLSASVNNVIQRWKLLPDNTISKEDCVSVVNEGFNSIALRKDGRIFATGGWDRQGRVFSVKKLRPLAVLTYHKESINCVAFGPNNELVMASKDGYITFWDVYKNS